jgi:hypothetical protein
MREPHMFTWIPFYEELANLILAYRSRQEELIGILTEIKGMNLPVISLEDKGAEGPLPLKEIDPFTFFATFNRGITKENRIAILKVLQTKMQVTASVPSDFEGIPVVNMRSARFFPPKKDRNLGDIEALWDLAEAGVFQDIQAIPGDLFQRCLEIKSNGLPKLTVGLFWLRPKKFMPFDRHSRNFFQKRGVFVDVHDFDTYKNFLHEVRKEFKEDFPDLSRQAYEDDIGPENENKYWQIAPGEKARLWDDLRSNSIVAIGWSELNFDLTGKSKEEPFQTFPDTFLESELRRRHPHDLRHTYATLLLMDHYSPAYVQRQLGHASISITVDTYGHWLPGEGRRDLGKTLRQATRLPKALEAPQSGSRSELCRRLALVGGSPTGARVGQVDQGQQTQGSTGQQRSSGQEIGQEWGWEPHKKGVILKITPS